MKLVYFCFQEESSATDDNAQDRFIGPLPREGSVGCGNDYVNQSYSYSSVLSKSETGIVLSLLGAMLVCNYFVMFSNSISRFLKLIFVKAHVATAFFHHIFSNVLMLLWEQKSCVPLFSILICCCVPIWVVRIVLPKSIHLKLCVCSQFNEYLILSSRGAVQISALLLLTEVFYCSPWLQFLCLCPRGSSSPTWLPTSKRRLLWKGSAALPRRQVPGQIPGDWLGTYAVQGAGGDKLLVLNLLSRHKDDIHITPVCVCVCVFKMFLRVEKVFLPRSLFQLV